MSDVFVRFEEVTVCASRVADLAGDSDQKVKDLLTRFEGFDAPWGGDAPGQAFFGAYQDTAREALSNAAQAPHQVRAISEALAATVKAYRENEQTNADMAGHSHSGEPDSRPGETESLRV